MPRALFGLLGFVVVLAARPICAQERGGSPVALDFSPIGENVASPTGAGAAPADVNFGIYPLSVMGIENAIRHADGNIEAYTDRERRVDDGPIAYAVVAIRAWERRYPSDPWIAKDLLALARFYEHVDLPETRLDAERAIAWVMHDYPRTAYAAAAGRMNRGGEREVLAPSEPVGANPMVATPTSTLPPYAHVDAGH